MRREPLRELTNLLNVPPPVFTVKVSDTPALPRKSKYKTGYYRSVFETRVVNNAAEKLSTIPEPKGKFSLLLKNRFL